MNQLLSPTRVTPVPRGVATLNVQHSQIVLPSPISSRVGSPRYLTSCGGVPIEHIA